MELRQILRVIKRWWWLGALPVVVVIATLALTARPIAPTYQVVLRFTTGSRPAESLSSDYDRYYAWLSSEYIANGLADLAKTSAFSQAVSAALDDRDLQISPQALQGAIVTDNSQSVMVLYVTWHDPQQAVIIADVVAETLIEKGRSYYPQMDGIGSIAHLADVPVAIPLAPSLTAQLVGPAIRLAVAAAAGLGLIALAHYIDPWIRDKDDLSAAGLPILAIIPRCGKNNARP